MHCLEVIVWIHAGFLFYTKMTQTTLLLCEWLCSQALFVLRPLITWKLYSSKIFSDASLQSHRKSLLRQTVLMGVNKDFVFKLWKKRFRKAWRRRKWLATSDILSQHNDCEQLTEQLTQTMEVLWKPVLFTDLLQWNIKGDHYSDYHYSQNNERKW